MFRNDLSKATGLRKRRKKKKIFVMKFTGTNVPGGSAFAATAGQGTRGSEALWGGQNLLWIYRPSTAVQTLGQLEPGGCAIPGREEIWPRSSTATVCCVTLNHILTSLCSVEPWGSYEGSSGLGMAILSTSNQESRS